MAEQADAPVRVEQPVVQLLLCKQSKVIENVELHISGKKTTALYVHWAHTYRTVVVRQAPGR